ncbi:MAG: crotonase/enoyl-CoA hydratase family protein [Microthrixaceae bacterium]|nr:crotonase/enoyl-CoA hydratase family protein [Microthrixaceae bacterium]MCO5319488.1 crotonase/enoyl-CoA hydratase family protein [Microthrixaceae bacterium]
MTVEYEKQGNVGVITINRPDARNAVNSDVAQGIESAIDRIEEDSEVWVGILTGARTEKGYIFCAGADLKQMSVDPGGMSTEKGGFAGFVQRERTKPIIAAVDGPALAGGTELVLACDMVVASRTAKFGIPEVKRNLVAAAGGLFRLPRKLPRNIAMELALTGSLEFPAERAHHFGLVNRLSEEGEALATAQQLAAEICENAPLAVAESRRIMLEATDQPDEVGWKLSGDGIMKMFGTEDFAEGLTAFAEKRAPQWKGR